MPDEADAVGERVFETTLREAARAFTQIGRLRGANARDTYHDTKQEIDAAREHDQAERDGAAMRAGINPNTVERTYPLYVQEVNEAGDILAETPYEILYATSAQDAADMCARLDGMGLEYAPNLHAGLISDTAAEPEVSLHTIIESDGRDVPDEFVQNDEGFIEIYVPVRTADEVGERDFLPLADLSENDPARIFVESHSKSAWAERTALNAALARHAREAKIESLDQVETESFTFKTVRWDEHGAILTDALSAQNIAYTIQNANEAIEVIVAREDMGRVKETIDALVDTKVRGMSIARFEGLDEAYARYIDTLPGPERIEVESRDTEAVDLVTDSLAERQCNYTLDTDPDTGVCTLSVDAHDLAASSLDTHAEIGTLAAARSGNPKARTAVNSRLSRRTQMRDTHQMTRTNMHAQDEKATLGARVSVAQDAAKARESARLQAQDTPILERTRSRG